MEREKKKKSMLSSAYNVSVDKSINCNPSLLFSQCSIDKASKVTSPVLVIHGTEDEVIDFSHGLAIYERCQRTVEPLWVEGAGHNDVELYGQYLERLRQFITVELPNLWLPVEDEATTTTDIADTGIVMVTDNNTREGASNKEGANKTNSRKSSASGNGDAKPEPKEKQAGNDTTVVDCHTAETGERL